jgi:hypothetical protein
MASFASSTWRFGGGVQILAEGCSCLRNGSTTGGSFASQSNCVLLP